MSDTVDAKTRSLIMARVRAKHTGPEMIVRRLVHAAGYRYRLHGRDLPGKPDLIFHSRRKVIFVHGCFWHRHEECALARVPKSRIDFWLTKLEGNRLRDQRNAAALRGMGWEVLVIWECQLKNQVEVLAKIKSFLDSKLHAL